MGTSSFNAAIGTADVAYAPAYAASSATQAVVHSVAGAMSGGINAAITGGNIGMGALTGGISGGIGKYAGGFLSEDFGSQLMGRSLIGGVTGGISAELYGGSFGQGFGQGAWTGGFGYLFNDLRGWFFSRLYKFVVNQTGIRIAKLVGSYLILTENERLAKGAEEEKGFLYSRAASNFSLCVNNCSPQSPGWQETPQGMTCVNGCLDSYRRSTEDLSKWD
jgi:hypothetical protein